MTSTRSPRRIGLGLGVLVVLSAIVAGALLTQPSSKSAAGGLASNPNLDPGAPLSRPAPDFTLTDELGRPVSLHSYRGRVVILAFNDSECTTVCPLTTTAMLDAKAMLGRAGSQVQLLGIDANPTATAVSDVRSYSELHGMLSQWHFLTAPYPELKRVWRAYDVDVQIEAGQIDHTPALYVIDPEQRLRRVYLTQMSYATVPQLGQLLAQEVAGLLPGHPHVDARLSYAQIPGITPTQHLYAPRAGGGTVRLGPTGGPRLFLFFATWDAEVTDLSRQLDALNGTGLPGLTAVDEASVEPSPGALPRFLARLKAPLDYPVALDRTGRVADGYGVQDEPWLVLVSASGQVLWYYDVSTSGWLGTSALRRQVSAALSAPPVGLPAPRSRGASSPARPRPWPRSTPRPGSSWAGR